MGGGQTERERNKRGFSGWRLSGVAPEDRPLSWEIQAHIPREEEWAAAPKLGLFWHKASIKEAA